MNQVPSYHDGETLMVALMGHPVRHTASPVFQNAALDILGINAVYIPFDVAPEMLEQAFKGLNALGVIGTNVTVPHKEAVFKLCDECSDEATLIEAVNTVVFIDGKTYGYNTDAYGIAAGLAESRVFFKNSEVVVLGAGGASKAIVAQAILDGAEKITVVNRSLDRAEQLIERIVATTKKIKTDLAIPDCKAIGYDDIQECLSTADILINATSVGLKAEDQLLFDPKFIESSTFVYDTIYNPSQTKLLLEANKMGCRRTANGLSMLVHQGAKSFEIWWKRPAPINVMKKKLMEPSFTKNKASRDMV